MTYKSFADVAAQLIKVQALVKVVNVLPDQKLDDPWNEHPGGAHNVIKQLLQPTTYRPVRSLHPEVDRSKRFNPKTKKWETRQVNPTRGSPKPSDWKYTKGSSTTLLPPHGKMKLFSGMNPGNPPIGYIFDLTKCDRKDDRYIGKGDLATNTKWWLDYSKLGGEEERSKLREERSALMISLEDLQNELRTVAQTGEPPKGYNEAYVGLSRESLTGLCLPTADYTVEMLLAVIEIKLECEKYLDAVLPVIIIDEKKGYEEVSHKDLVERLHALINSRRIPEEIKNTASKYSAALIQSGAVAFNAHQAAFEKGENLQNIIIKYETLQEAHKNDLIISPMVELILRLAKDKVASSSEDKTLDFSTIWALDTLYELSKLDEHTFSNIRNSTNVLNLLQQTVAKLSDKEQAIVNPFILKKLLHIPQIQQVYAHNQKFIKIINVRLAELQKSLGLGKGNRLKEWGMIADKAEAMIRANPLERLNFDKIIKQVGVEKLHHALELKSQGLWGKTRHKDSKNLTTINQLKELNPSEEHGFQRGHLVKRNSY